MLIHKCKEFVFKRIIPNQFPPIFMCLVHAIEFIGLSTDGHNLACFQDIQNDNGQHLAAIPGLSHQIFDGLPGHSVPLSTERSLVHTVPSLKKAWNNFCP